MDIEVLPGEIRFRPSKEVARALKRLAEQEGSTPNDLAEKIVTEYVLAHAPEISVEE